MKRPQMSRNPVAKYSFQHSAVHKDRKAALKRGDKPKHAKKESPDDR